MSFSDISALRVTLTIYLFYNLCRSYQYYKCYYHVWAANYNAIQ